MRYRQIGQTDIMISEVGLGCWALGGPNWENGKIANGWSEINPDEVKEAVAYAVDHGVTHFDNADVYGNGRAERLLADSLQGKDKTLIIASKVGWFAGTAKHAYEPTNIRHQCEQSLKNLNRDVIDIYYFHHGDFGKGDTYLADAVEEMYRLKAEGKIRAIGLSCYSQKDFKRLMPTIKPDVVQSWAHMMDYHFVTKNSELMQLCDRYGATFVGFQPFNQGILLNKYSSKTPPTFGEGDHRADSPKFKPDFLAEVEKGLDPIIQKIGSSVEELARVAMQFVLYHQAVSGVIPGFRNLEQVKANLVGVDQPLNGEEISLIYKAFQ